MLTLASLMSMNFIAKAITAGMALCLVTGPLGSILAWRRMAYFGDTLAHSTLLGLSIAIIFNFNIYMGLIIISLLVAVLLHLISKYKFLANDTILGILSHTTLSVGLIIATIFNNVRLNLMGYLFGDILSVQIIDLILIGIVITPMMLILYVFWNKIVSVTVSAEIAACEKTNPNKVNWLIIILLAVVFALAIKIVGILLINALLIIPAANARLFSRSPEQMVITASSFGAIGICSGILSSSVFDLPAGPAIICSLAIMFFCSFIFQMLKNKILN